jgi:hypothetical protein
MPTEVNPPPNESYETGGTPYIGDCGQWRGYTVIDGMVLVPIVGVEEVIIPPNCENVDAHLAVSENYDEPIDGFELTFEVPDIERWNSLSDKEYSRLQEEEGVYKLRDLTREEVWLFSDPRDVSHGWDSPWHGLAAMKRNILPKGIGVENLVGNRILVAGHMKGENINWVIDTNSPISKAICQQ